MQGGPSPRAGPCLGREGRGNKARGPGAPPDAQLSAPPKTVCTTAMGALLGAQVLWSPSPQGDVPKHSIRAVVASPCPEVQSFGAE